MSMEKYTADAPATQPCAGDADVFAADVMSRSQDAPELTTPRLRLRAFAAEDAGALFACCRNPRLGDDAGWQPHESLEESRQVLREVFLAHPTVWAVAERETGRLIGAVALMPDPKREHPGVAMLGYWLDEASWGRGAMSEACRRVLEYGFATLGCEAVTATCYPHNLRSKRLIERIGFQPEGGAAPGRARLPRTGFRPAFVSSSPRSMASPALTRRVPPAVRSARRRPPASLGLRPSAARLPEAFRRRLL